MTISVKDGSGTPQTVKTIDDLAADGGMATIGAKADAADTHTDATAITAMQVWKQISKTLQGLLTNTTALFARISDGTNNVTIKGASTGAAAPTDVAMVVTVRDQNSNGAASAGNSSPVVPAGYGYETVAASQTDQVMGGTGATGDTLFGVLIVPATTGAGTVSIKDGSGSAINIFVTGTLSNLVPFFVPLNIRSTGGAWKITTGANVSAIGVGVFT